MEQNKKNDKINEILTKIKGIKHIKIIICVLIAAIIMLIYGSLTTGKNSAADTKSEPTGGADVKTVSYSESEEKLADILSRIDGIGQTKVMISYSDNDAVCGVIVVAEGADNPLAEWKIRHAVQTALKIDYHSVEVYSMK